MFGVGQCNASCLGYFSNMQLINCFLRIQVFKYGQLVCTVCPEVMFRYIITTGRELLPDKIVTVQDKTASVADKS